MMLFDDFINRFLYRWQVGLQPEQDLSEIYWMVSYWVRDIVLLFNTFVMYLGFKFNEKQYRFFVVHVMVNVEVFVYGQWIKKQRHFNNKKWSNQKRK